MPAPKSANGIALIVVDVQNDFISGTLSISNCPAGHNGNEVVPVINNMLSEPIKFDTVVYSLDWHPNDHISFFENIDKRPIDASSPVKREDAKLYDKVVFTLDKRTNQHTPTAGLDKMEQIMWPRHCVQATWGAEMHPDLTVVPEAIFLRKGFNVDVDSYSAFYDNAKLNQTDLDEQLKQRETGVNFVCGIAYDVCVAFTCLHSLELGYVTYLVTDASRGIDEAGISEFNEQFTKAGGKLIESKEVAAEIKRLRAAADAK